MAGSGAAGGSPEPEPGLEWGPELAESYRLCEQEVADHLASLRAISDALPPEVRPYVHALNGFASRSDRIADADADADADATEGRTEGRTEGPAERERRFARWRADTLAELAAGRSGHPLRRAFVDTVRRWGLDPALVEEFLDATRADGARPPAFGTHEDQRRHLRGVAGTITELWAPLLGARGREAADALSALGEACQLADILEDLPLDLAAGRCYLPGEDLRRLGLTVADLGRDAHRADHPAGPRADTGADPRADPGAARRDALDELVASQRGHLHRLLERALPATWLAAPECRPFLHAVLLGAQLQYDEVTLVGSRVLTEGLTPLRTDGTTPLRRTRSAPAEDVPAEDTPTEDAPTEDAPAHVAVIMDGNRRWAEARRLPARQGHQAGQRAALRLVNAALRLGVRYLSLYAFSSENWGRPPEELTALFDSLADGLTRSAESLHALGVRIRWCGRRDRVDESLASSIALVESLTSNNGTLTLTVCVDYGGREELAAAARGLAAEAVSGGIRPEQIGPADLARHLYVPDLPDVDLLIRTSGEQRISNFLPWQLAYAELLFDPTPWPDYDLARLRGAVRAYADRERRFGGGVPAQPRASRGDRPASGSTAATTAAATAATPARPGEGCTSPRP
ncbi:polyprenyl diphosphate synthase [Kitasatospora sp. NPDC091335]|uniref:polyprenyl diphosphate synthase n=1 Tax=Kitasatospora sp. NPDC091335 TaxID=3364085 RepID=UPI00382F23BE